MMDQLLKIMALLRDKQHGCAWDNEQTFETITRHTLEEVYEVIEAIEEKDYKHLPNELGDLLFQVVFYAQIGKEEGLFDFNDVVTEISHKLLTRHPHVFPDASIDSFGTESLLTPAEVESNWEQIKITERQKKGVPKVALSELDDVPAALPAIMRAQKLQSRAANVGFDWNQTKQVINKVKEELAELEEAIEKSDQLNIKEELGDLLFTMVNLSRHLKVDPEDSLRAANGKFEARFREMEVLSDADKQKFSQLSLDEMELYWEKVKRMKKEEV